MLFSSVLLATALYAGGADNPLFAPFNENIDYSALTADHVKSSTEQIIARTRESLKKIYAIKKEDRTFDNTMLALDNAYNEEGKISYIVYLMANAHPNDATREQANASLAVIGQFENEWGLDEELYRSVKEYAESKDAKSLTGHKKKFLDDVVRGFERNGFALTKEKRDELKKIQDRINDLGIAFSKNIAEATDTLAVGEAETEGLPEDFKNSYKTADGTYKFDTSYPSYVPFMKYAKSESARKALYTKSNNRAADKNLTVLRDLIIQRQQMAHLLTYKTYAQYIIQERMAKTPKAVWDFENALVDKVKQKARRDYDELLEVKRNATSDQKASVINPWEAAYYNNMLLKEKYSVDDEKFKEYFELNNVMNGLFQIAQHLFDVEFSEVQNPSVWHPDVRMFEVKQKGKVIAHFYLDLYPRANKYGHAACFGMIKGKMTSDGYQLPSATLECNFPRPTADKPSLMYHSTGSASVETFFHEFGHVLHNMLTQSELFTYSGTATPRDFVEAPSQIYENWVWNYDVLKMFAKHYKTGEVLPRELFDKKLAAKNVGSGLAATQQVFYGMLDMTLEDRWDPNGKESTTDIVKKLQNEVTLYPYLDGTHMEAAFGHLNGYGAGYYGYMWSKVYAEDMFSIFEKNGVMDQKTGLRYRDIILAKGGSVDPLELVKQFLGRDPNQNAFFKSLGL